MCGRRSGRGFAPVEVGRREDPLRRRRAEPQSEHEFVSQPFAAIQRACGATPIWLAPGSPSSPTIVPIVCVPWPLLSHGTSDGLPQTCDGSNQL